MKLGLKWLVLVLLVWLPLESFAQVPLPDNDSDEICPILPGSDLPDALLRTTAGDTIQLSDWVKGKPTVLVVYRGGWCPYCVRQLKGLREVEDEILEAGYQIIAVSPDQPSKMAESLEKMEPGYRLLSDSQLALSTALGLTFKVDAATLRKYKTYGIDLVEASGETHERLPVPAVLIISKKGVVEFVYARPDYKQRLDAQVLLAILQSLED